MEDWFGKVSVVRNEGEVGVVVLEEVEEVGEEA